MNKQRGNFLSPERPNQASGDLKMSDCFCLPYIFDIYLPIVLPTKNQVLKIRISVQKSNIGHLNNLERYKMLKLLRSYSASKGQARVKLCGGVCLRLGLARISLNCPTSSSLKMVEDFTSTSKCCTMNILRREF
jgi:hypothetical protein